MPDLTPLMDLTFNIISFFVMINTFAQDDATQRIRLPVSTSAAVLEEERIPDSLYLNIDAGGVLLGWGLSIDLHRPAGFDQLNRLLKNEAAIQKDRQRQQGKDWKTEGLTTTLVLRIDRDVDYAIFRKVMDACREAGFRKFQLKALEEEPKPGTAS